MDRLPNQRNVELTPEAIAKSDKDIRTIAAISALATQKGGKLVLYGGYATEVQCGGKITRPHGDIDSLFVSQNIVTGSDIFPDIENVLETEKTNWQIIKKYSLEVDYREDAESKNLFDRRRLEVSIPALGRDSVEFEEGILIDSNGGAVVVYVVGFDNLVASKISKFYEIKDAVTKKDRHTSETDYYDLRRLIALPRFTKEKVFLELVKLIGSEKKAQEMWDYAVSLGFEL